jgi:hypothetical protein
MVGNSARLGEANMQQLDIQTLINEAAKLGYTFTHEEAQDVIDTGYGDESEAQAVQDYLDAFGG